MKINKSEHITRYFISLENREYIRLVEKDIHSKNKISWMLIENDVYYMIEEEEFSELEKKFLKQLE